MPAPLLTVEAIKAALRRPLPGWPAQKLMAPEARLNIDRRSFIRDDHREGGVLLLAYPGAQNRLHLTLIRRPEYNGVHSGQIALPGGAREPNETRQQTALREAFEEIGVLPQELTVLGALSSIYIFPSNFLVYPTVACHPARPVFKPNRREVAEIIEAPLTFLFDKTLRQTELRTLPRLGRTELPFYNVLGHRVWGATAMILSEFSEALKAEIGPLEAER
ncbi:MAG: NUDIX hydrolase [Anaerolineae bacterium]